MVLMVIEESGLETLVLIGDLEGTIVKQVDSKKAIAANQVWLEIKREATIPFFGSEIGQYMYT